MQTISAAFAAALKKSHQIVTKAEILVGGRVSGEIRTLVGGEVQIERNAAVRRRCSVEIADPTGTLVPSSSGSLLTPYGNEIKLYRGIRLATGDEYVPLGVFRISKVKVSDQGDGLHLAVQGYDRSRSIARGRLTAPYMITAGTNYGTAIQNLIGYVRPTTFNFVTTTATTPTLTFLEGDDPWKKAQEMAEAIGCEIFFDADGVCRMVTVSNSSASVWSYAEGAEAMFLSIDRDLDDETTYNGVICTGESPDLAAPVRAESWDQNTASPTYYLGPYGKVPFFMSSPYVRTQAQAQAAADGRLLKVLGATESLAFSSIVNPAHDAGDAVSVVRARSGVGTTNPTYVLDDLTIPLEASREMTARVRQRRSLS